MIEWGMLLDECVVYLNNRHYDPSVGVFISVDPLVSMTGEPYIYGAANPVTMSDPSGLCAGSEVLDQCVLNDGTVLDQGTNRFRPGPMGVHEQGPPAPGQRRQSRPKPKPCVDACVGLPVAGSVPVPPRQNWTFGYPELVSGGQSITADLPPECNIMQCDVVVVATYAGGVGLGGGTVTASHMENELQRFADVGVSATGYSTVMVFHRREFPTTVEEAFAISAPIAGVNLDGLANGHKVAYNTSPTVTVTVEKTALGALVGNSRLSASVYYVEIAYNVGAPLPQGKTPYLTPTGG